MASPSLVTFPGADVFPEAAPPPQPWRSAGDYRAGGSSPQVRVGGSKGLWLSTLAPVGDIEVDVRWPLGGYELSFSVLLGARRRPAVIAKGAPCDLLLGGRVVFPGRISEVDWSEGKVTATGLCRDAETTAALTAGGTTTSTPNVAIDAAISRGAWAVTRPASLSSAAMASVDETDHVNYVAQLLDMWANDNGKRWYVDSDKAVRAGVDPTTPELYLLPGAGELSWATEKEATRVIGRWMDASGVFHTSFAGSGSQEQIVDLTDRGVLNGAQAVSILNQILARSSSGSWAGGVTVSADQLVTVGGLRMDPSRVVRMAQRGLMVRLLGHRDPRPGRFSLTTDVVIGQAVWNVSGRTVALTPMGSVARDFASIVESFGGSVAS